MLRFVSESATEGEPAIILKSYDRNMPISNAKRVHDLVLDTGPLLKNEPPVSTLLEQSEALYTVPAVIKEIRDAVARSRVETTLLPFLNLRAPGPVSLKTVSDFARKTGDLEVLSRVDIQVLALAYELECERNHGDWRLRSVPGQKRINGAPPAPPQDHLTATVIEKVKIEKTPEQETREAWGTAILPVAESILSTTAQQVITNAGDETDQTPAAEQANTGAAIKVNDQSLALEMSRDSGSDESDDEGWITPLNIEKHRRKDLDVAVEPQEEFKVMQVATVTTDFAMQNVLLRMNLNLLSSSLQKIQELKTWVLRCHACFNITKDMEKQFCSRCGKPTLLRTSCSTDKDGKFEVHLKKNYQWNTRGDIYSIPKPVPGSASGKIVAGGGKGGWGQELILTEDQKEYVQATTNARRKKDTNFMDEDYLPNILSGDRRNPEGRPKVGAGRNVNSRKRHK